VKALILVTNPIESPGERYRVYQFIPSLERAGIECHVDALFTSRSYAAIAQGRSSSKVVWTDLVRGLTNRVRSLVRGKDFDVALIYRHPVFFSTSAVPSLLQRAGVPYLLDFDDAIFLPSPDPSTRLTGLLKRPASLPRLIKGARVTTVGNNYLADYARQHTSAVEVIPTCVDTERFSMRPQVSGAGELVIGWIGSRSTVPYLRLLDDVWSTVNAHGRLELRIVGGCHVPAGVKTRCEPWSLESEQAALHTFDIGVMPLPDDEWAKGKCGLKILQYMASGVPVVASRVGVNPEIITDGENGFLASSVEEWGDKLSKLASDPDLRRSMGRAGRVTVETDYSVAKWAPRLAEVMLQAAERSRDTERKDNRRGRTRA
jgi:glycosyltransferase involved in cell wall biosynthesis